MKKEQKIERALKLIWDSLQSHLEWTYKKDKSEDPKFHKQCVKEYAELIKIISELYD